MSRRVLVYLEPAIFRDDPAFLDGHLDCFAHPILQALSSDGPLEFLGLASNIFLALKGLDAARQLPACPGLVRVYPLYNRDLLHDLRFSLEDYASDVFGTRHADLRNPGLLRLLRDILRDARPDCVVTSSQNRYLTQLADEFGFKLLSVEFGPLPRLPYPLNRFLSVEGHLSEGPFSSAERLLEALRRAPAVTETQALTAFEAQVLQAVTAHPQCQAVQDCVQRLRSQGTVTLLALQPEQWMTWEGSLGERRSCVSIILETLSRLRTDKLIVTFHLDKTGRINPISLREIWLSDPRLELLPADLSVGISEVFLPFVDELATVSSNIAMGAFLLGKPLLPIGDSFVRTLGDLQTPDPTDVTLRARVLAFLQSELSIDDGSFRDPARLRMRLDTLLGTKAPTDRSPARTPAIESPDDAPLDVRHAELGALHERIARHRSAGASTSQLLERFGRHALGHVVATGGVGAEFGVASGYFSEALLRAGQLSLLHSIDRWSDHHDDAEFERVAQRLAVFGARSRILRMSFDEALTAIPDASLDFVYVDGYAHTGHDADIAERCLAKLKPGGLIAVHDHDPFSWPINHRRLQSLFSSRPFERVLTIPPVLTANNEDIFPGLLAQTRA